MSATPDGSLIIQNPNDQTMLSGWSGNMPVSFPLKGIATNPTLSTNGFNLFDRAPRTFCHMGDSRVAGMYLDGAKANKSTNNQWNNANRALGNRMQVVGNFAVAGQTSIDQLAYIDQAIATRASNFSFQGGVNDFTANIPTGTPAYPGDQLNTTWGAVWYMCEKARLSGMRIWIWLDPGSSNQNAAQLGLRNDYNQRIREYAETTPNVIVCDLPTWALNPVATTVVVWKLDGAGNTYSTDGTHLTTVGGVNVGSGPLATLVAQYVPPLNHIPGDSLTIAGNGSSSLTPNPMFKIGTGGTLQAGATGVLPGSVIGSASGTSSFVGSVAPDADGFGNEITMAVTNGALNNRARLLQNLSTTILAGGNKYVQIGCEIDMAAGATGVFYVVCALNITVDMGDGRGPIQYFKNDAISTVDRLEDKGGYSGYSLQTDALYIPAGIVTSPIWKLDVQAFGTGGSASVKVRKPWDTVRYSPTYP